MNMEWDDVRCIINVYENMSEYRELSLHQDHATDSLR